MDREKMKYIDEGLIPVSVNFLNHLIINLLSFSPIKKIT